MYEFRDMCGVDDDTVARVCTRGFSDYFMPASFSAESVALWRRRASVKREFSALAYHADEPVGALITGAADYRGEYSAFGVAGAVSPEHRRRGVFTGMFEAVRATLLQAGVGLYTLEALRVNTDAIRLYERLGFNVLRGYSMFAGKPVFADEREICDVPLDKFDMAHTAGMHVPAPSFECCTACVSACPELYRVAYDSKLCAFALYDPKNGDVHQLGYAHEPADILPVLAHIAARCPRLCVWNLDTSETELIATLKASGLSGCAEQWEMGRRL